MALFLLGTLAVLGGVFFALREGLSFYTVWYLGIGGLVVALAIAGLLGLVRVPIRTREDAILVLARPSMLVFLLLTGGLTFIIVTMTSYMWWPDSAFRLAVYSAFFLVLFAYARRWKKTHVTVLSAEAR